MYYFILSFVFICIKMEDNVSDDYPECVCQSKYLAILFAPVMYGAVILGRERSKVSDGKGT
jgi:hypothetical protein